jgi:hypothetical protein
VEIFFTVNRPTDFYGHRKGVKNRRRRGALVRKGGGIKFIFLLPYLKAQPNLQLNLS